MSGSSAALSASELAHVTAGHPILVASNAIRDPVSDPRWVNSAAGNYTDDDWTDSQYPTSFLYDGHGHLRSRPAYAQMPYIYSGEGYWRLPFRIDPDTDFDCAAIIGHNLGTIGGSFIVALQVDDRADFATALQIATWTPVTTDRRLSSVVLKHTGTDARRYSGYTYGRVILEHNNTDAFLPQIGEVWLGRRRQITHKPRIPYDDASFDGRTIDVETESGAHVSYVQFRGRRTLAASIRTDDTTEIADIRSWFSEADYGMRHFLWIEDPSTPSTVNANTYLMRLSEMGRLTFPLGGPTHREWTLEALEVPPFLSAE